MLIFGILIGAIAGVVLGLIPGFNIGFSFLFAITLPDPYFAVGLILGIDSTSSIMKHLNLLNADIDEDENRLTKQDNSLIYTSLVSSMSGKFLGSFVSVGLIIFLGDSVLKLDGLVRALSLCMIMFVWGMLIWRSKDKFLALIALAGSALIAILCSNLPINQPMFVLTSCMFSTYTLRGLVEANSKIRIKSINQYHNGVEIAQGFFAGALSSVLWGLPTSVICKSMEEDFDKPHNLISRKAFADGVNAVLGLTIFLTVGGYKIALASNLSRLNLQFNSTESVGIVIISLALSLLGYILFNPMLAMYLSIQNWMPGIINKGIIVLTLATILILSKFWAIALIPTCLMLQNLIRLANAPKEVALGALSILPLLALF